MVRAGDRRVRTRLLGALAGAAAVLAAVALTAPLLSSSDRAVTPAALGPVAPLTWVEGSTLHADGQVFELSFRPVTYVRTSVGYVFSDRGGRVWSWVDGDVREVGSTDATRPHLVSDDESGLAGWLDPVNGSYAVLDQRPNGSVVHHRAPTGSRPQDFVGIDAGSTYWESGDGLVGFDLATGRSTPIDVGGTIADVEDGLVAIRTEAGISVRDLAGAEVRMLEDFHGEAGSFSPDARYFTNDADVPLVYDVAAGQRVDVSVGDREFASGYEVPRRPHPGTDRLGRGQRGLAHPAGALHGPGRRVRDRHDPDDLRRGGRPARDPGRHQDRRLAHTLADPEGRGACQCRQIASNWPDQADAGTHQRAHGVRLVEAVEQDREGGAGECRGGVELAAEDRGHPAGEQVAQHPAADRADHPHQRRGERAEAVLDGLQRADGTEQGEPEGVEDPTWRSSRPTVGWYQNVRSPATTGTRR